MELRAVWASGNLLVKMTDVTAICAKGSRLENLNFDLWAGETHAILSTFSYNQHNFLDLFNGGLQRYAGDYRLFGSPYRHRDKLLSQIQIYGTDSCIVDSLSPAENILLASLPLIKGDLLTRCRSLMGEVGLHLDLLTPICRMSPDELRAVELLHICAMRPKIVLFIDTLNYLGELSKKLIPQVIAWLKKHRCGIIYCTSSFEDALSVGDRISVFDGGTNRGTYPVEAVRECPGLIADLLSGWEPVISSQPSDESIKIMEAISQIGDKVMSDHELKRVLHYIAIDLVKALGADSCMIYLLDEARLHVLDAIPSEKTPLPRLRHVDILSLMQQDDAMVLHGGTAAFHSLFPDTGGVAAVILHPLRLDGRKNALIQVTFAQEYKSEKQTLMYLRMFAKEIAMAIETSRLLGNSVLLQESHHRIKNNLQMIINLLYLQKPDGTEAENQNVGDILDTAIRRIKSISSVHALLCRDWYGKNVVNLKTLILEILQMYRGFGIRVRSRLTDMSIPYHTAVSLALLVNELVSNAAKHAFAPGETDKGVWVTLQNSGLALLLTVRDNGRGFPPAFSWESAESIGLGIVNSIVNELHGKLKLDHDGGAKITIRFPRDAVTPMLAYERPEQYPS